MTKTALLGLTKTASLDLASENITVNCIAPGIVKTKFSKAVRILNTVQIILSRNI